MRGERCFRSGWIYVVSLFYVKRGGSPTWCLAQLSRVLLSSNGAVGVAIGDASIPRTKEATFWCQECSGESAASLSHTVSWLVINDSRLISTTFSKGSFGLLEKLKKMNDFLLSAYNIRDISICLHLFRRVKWVPPKCCEWRQTCTVQLLHIQGLANVSLQRKSFP